MAGKGQVWYICGSVRSDFPFIGVRGNYLSMGHSSHQKLLFCGVTLLKELSKTILGEELNTISKFGGDCCVPPKPPWNVPPR
jgi:hypothetical protein